MIPRRAVQDHWILAASTACAEPRDVIKASAHFGLSVTPSFSGALLWPFMYPWPQRPAGIVEEAFKELATRWLPILNYADAHGIDIAVELHPPGEDLHDGASFERFLEASGDHPRVAINEQTSPPYVRRGDQSNVSQLNSTMLRSGSRM